ncbi:uncharacterized protein LOC144618392 [Crassostrea virginica]
MQLYRALCWVFLGTLFSPFLLFHECRELEGYKFPVFTTESCPKNETEWEARSAVFFCQGESSYACLPNENITELLEFCYPLQVISIHQGVCLFLKKDKSVVDSYDCHVFNYGCPTGPYFGSTVYKYPSCVSIGSGCFLAESSCESATQQTKQERPGQSNKSELIWIPSLLGVLVLCTILFISLAIYKRNRRNNRQQTNDEENPETHQMLSYEDEENDLDDKQHTEDEKDSESRRGVSLNEKKTEYKESDYEKSIFRQWQEDDIFFVSTKASNKVENVVKKNNLIIVVGHSGSGKSAIIQHIALKYREQGWVVKPMYSVEEMHDAFKAGHYMKDKTIFVFNDPIGKEAIDEILHNAWERYRETVNLLIKPIKLFLSCRTSVILDQRAEEFLKEKRKIIDIDESDIKLNKEEKILMLEKHFFEDKPTQEEIDKILETDMYFPLLCKMYSSYSKKGKNKVTFFKEPVTVLSKEIKSYKNKNKDRYCALVCLVLFNDKVCLNDLMENSTLFSKSLQLCKLPPNTLPSTIFNDLRELEGCLVKKIDNIYSFYHDFVLEVTSLIIGKEHPVETIQYADISFLRRRVCLEKKTNNDNCTISQSDDCKRVCLEKNPDKDNCTISQSDDCNDELNNRQKTDNDNFTISLSNDYIDELVNRLFQELFGDRFLEVVLNPCLKEEKIVDGIIKRLEKDSKNFEMLIKRQTSREQQKLKMDFEMKDHFYFSRLQFVCAESALSPLFALIALQHDQISGFCIQKLQQNKTNLKNSYLYAAACCNGNEVLLKSFTKEQTSELKEEMWENMFPVHVISVFHNHNLIDDIIKNSNDANMFTKDDLPLTPLSLASFNNMEDEKECFSTAALRRDKTVERLIQKGAEVNLCKQNDDWCIHPLYAAGFSGHESTAQLLLKNGAEVNLCDEDGYGPLHMACQNGHESIVQLLLKNGAEVNLCTNDGTSPLWAAFQNEHESTVQLLLKNGAEVNLCDDDGDWPLHMACQNGHESTVQLLLKNGAEVNLCTYVSSPLIAACQNGHESTVQLLLKNGAEVNLCTYASSPLIAACQNGHESTVQLLLKNGAEVNLYMKYGSSPLFAACQNGHESTVKLLLKNGAEVNLCTYASSPLIAACQNGHESTVQLLLKNGAEVNLCDEDGYGPLHMACQNGHESIVQFLLKNGAEVNLYTINGSSPLIAACQNGHESTVQLLLKNGAGVNLCTKNGSSPLWTACQKGHESTVQLLLKNGAEVNLCTNASSPLFAACQNGHESTVQLLLKNGAEVNLCTKDGRSPLFAACENRHESTVQLLLKNGAEVNLCTEDDSSPLWRACYNGHESTAQLLLNNGAEVNLCTKDGKSPLFAACENRHESTVQLLLKNGAEVNLCDKHGWSPLWTACYNGHESTVQLLLKNGAEVNLCTEDGMSPLFSACQNGHESTAQLLLKNGAEVNLCAKDGKVVPFG